MFRIRNYIYKILALALVVLISSCDNPTQVQQTPTFTHSIIAEYRSLNNFFDCLENENITLISAHRGGEPENTIEGMEALLTKMPSLMEIDISTSKDGVLFLLHDDELQRTTTGRGNASKTSWNDIRSLNIRTGRRVFENIHPPSFDEVLAWADDKTILQLDIKRSTKYEDVVNAVKRADATSRVIYIAYSIGQARKLHRLHPKAMISLNIKDFGDLNEFNNSNIPSSRILAWTGNEAPAPHLIDELNKQGIEVVFGTLGGRYSIGNQISQSGSYRRYVEIADFGVDIIGSDNSLDAYAALKKAGRKTTSPSCGLH